MNNSVIIGIVVVVIVILGGWYFISRSNNAVPPVSQTQTTTGGTTGTATTGTNNTLGTGTSATSTIGTYLVASNGMTLYTFANDSTNVSTCTGQCAALWPPYTVADASALTNLATSLSGTVNSTVRADGSVQATYNGNPLYFYSKDVNPGDTNGQGIGNVWFVAKP